MQPFPDFMRQEANKIAAAFQHTSGIEGYVFDGADGSQIAFWTATVDAETEEHVHPFDEWFIVVEGAYVLVLNGNEIRVGAGQEQLIPSGSRVAGRVTAGTRTIHAFGGQRANRQAAGA